MKNSDSMSFSVELREWFILEVSDSSETLKSEGMSGAMVVSNLNLEGNPVQIRAFVSVAGNQAVQLRVQALGDLMNSRGEVLPVSDIAWEGFGEGFLNGILSKNGPEIVAQWVGSGFRQGTILYRYLKDRMPKGDYSQRIIYSLTAI